MTQETAPEEEKRQGRRNRVLKQGSILRGVNISDITCIVRDMSESGALLKVSIDQNIPEEFLLYVRHDGKAYRCQLQWRDGTRVGIKILGVEAKPNWHYG